MASVRKRKWTHNGVEKEAWVVNYTDQGGKRRQGGTFEKKRDADAERLRIEKEIEVGTHTPRSQTVTFERAAGHWMEDCTRRWRQKDKMAGSTLKKIESYVRLHLVPEFGRLPVVDLTFLKVQDFVVRKREVQSAGSIMGMVVALRGILSHSVDQGWLGFNPVVGRSVRIPGSQKNQKVIPTKLEIKKLLEALARRRKGEHETAFRLRVGVVTLALFAGMRRGEICGLQWENVDLTEGVINVRHSLSREDGLKGPKSAAGNRSIPMAAPVRNVFHWLLEDREQPDAGFVFVTPRGNPYSPQKVWGALWQPLMEAADLLDEKKKPIFSLHALRHAAASMLIQQGLDAFVLKSIIGHSSVQTTYDIYGHLFPDDDRGRNAIDAASMEFSAVPLPSPTRQGSNKSSQAIELSR